jgi:cell division protein FtsL
MPAIPVIRPDPQGAASSRRSAPAAQSASRPKLTVVARRRRRWPAVVVGASAIFVIVGMLGAAVFHTQLAERQLRIDRLERAVQAERERFDSLRHERAVLRSPQRLSDEAGGLGMVPGETSQFVAIDTWTVARQLATAGPIDDEAVRIIVNSDPLDQFRDVKAVSAGQP